MNSRPLGAFAAIVVLLAAVLAGLPAANAAPPQPYTYYGTARNSGLSPYPLGTRITAFIDGVDYSNGTSVYREPPGPWGNYDIDVFGDNHTTQAEDNTPTIKTGGDISDEVMLVAGDMTTVKSFNPQEVFTTKRSWASLGVGGSENITVTAAAIQPNLPKIGRIVTQPNDPWPQYLFLCNPTVSDIVMDATNEFYLEKDVPHPGGTYFGPRHDILPGDIAAGGGIFYVNLTSWNPVGTDLVQEGDAIKLVWRNTGSAFGTSDIIVDRVEFNSTTFTTQFMEPVNTIMTDAVAPGLGQEIRRISANSCQDTNSNSVDFGLQGATARPVAGNTDPTVTLITPVGGEVWTGLTVHRIDWTQSDIEDASLQVIIDVSNGTDTFSVHSSTRSNGANFFDWTVNCLNWTSAFLRIRVFDSSLASDQGGVTIEIDCSPPMLLATIPPNGQMNVDVNTDITLTFSEGMNGVATNGSISFAPPLPPVVWVTTWNPSGDTATLNPTAPFAVATMYTVTVGCGARDDSDPGNVLDSCPVMFTFTTSATVAPTVDLTDPDGGEVWSGFSSHGIIWTMSDSDTPGDLTATLEYNTNYPGGPWSPIAVLMAPQGSNTFPWAVACANTTAARVRVTVSDGALTSQDVSVANFTLDCAKPSVTATSPLSGAIEVALNSVVRITFSEPMHQGASQAAFSLSPSVTGPGFNWVSPSMLEVSATLTSCTPYTATVAATARDLSEPGNTMASAHVWSFGTVCAPTVVIIAPASAARLTGGSSHDIRYTVSDLFPGPAVSVWINWTSPAAQAIGASSLAPDVSQVRTQSFTVLPTDTASAQIQITARDSTGLIDVATVTFVIDAIAPTVLSSVPANNAQNVVATAALSITFSEAMNQSATGTTAIGLSPSAGNLTLTWTSASVVSVDPAQNLLPNTWYNLTVSTAAKDISNDGNALASQYRAQFKTSAAGAVTADADGPYTGETGEGIAFDGSNSMGTITNWTWVITLRGVGTTLSAFGEQPTVTFTTAGTYDVTLTVSDGTATDTDTTTATITRAVVGVGLLDYWWVFLILILAVFGALIFLLAKRRKKPEGMPPEVPPEEVEVTPPRGTAPPRAATPPPPSGAPVAAPARLNTKTCPACGTILDAADTECFMCGAKV